MTLTSLLKKSYFLAGLLGLAALTPSQGQNTDSYTANGNGVTTGSWDTAGNWSSGALPTSTQDVQFIDNPALFDGTGPLITGGSEVANSLWFNADNWTNTAISDLRKGFTFNAAVTLTGTNGTNPVPGFSGYTWGIVNTDGNFTINDRANFTSTVTLDNSQTAFAGSIMINSLVGAHAGSSLLITNQPGILGGQAGNQNGTANFSSAPVVIGTLTNISTVEVTTSDDVNSLISSFGEGVAGLDLVGTVTNGTTNLTGTNLILAGGTLTNTASSIPIGSSSVAGTRDSNLSLGSLALGVGTNFIENAVASEVVVISFTSLAGLSNSTPVNGAVLAVEENNPSLSETITIKGEANNTGGVNANNVNGIIGGWAISLATNNSANGSDWATYDTAGDIKALATSGYTYDNGVSNTGNSSAWASGTANIDIGTSTASAGNVTVTDSLTGNSSINSLRFGVASTVYVASGTATSDYLSSATVDLAGHQLVVNSGGIMDAIPNTAAASYLTGLMLIKDSVGTGSLTAGSGNNYNLYIYPGAGNHNGFETVGGTQGTSASDDSAPAFEITASITDNGSHPVSVVVAGAIDDAIGSVWLYGTNSYTGNTYMVGPGAAAINSSKSLGADGSQVIFNGGQLYINAPIANFNHQIVVDSGNGGIITVETIGSKSGGVENPASGLVLSDYNGAPAITGSGPLLIEGDNGLTPASGNSFITVELAGQSTLTGPLMFQNNTTALDMDVYLDNVTGSGYALNSDTYLNSTSGVNGTHAINLIWLASNQVNPTAVIDFTTVGTGTVQGAALQLNGFSDTIGGLEETDTQIGGIGSGVLENSKGTASTMTLNTVFRNDVFEGAYIYDGTISGTTTAGLINSGVVNLVKTGPAIQVLTGKNTYTGTTSVTSGTLLVESATTKGDNYTVSGGGDSQGLSATLGGGGFNTSIVLANSTKTFTVSGASSSTPGIIYPGPNGLSALSSSGVMPGTSDITGTGTPTSGNNILTLGAAATKTTVNFNANSELKLDIGGLLSLNTGLSSQLYVYGNININAASTLVLNLAPGITFNGTTGPDYVLAVTDSGAGSGTLNDGDTLGTVTGTFGSVVVTGGSLGSSLASYNYKVDYTTDPGEILLDKAPVIPAPEPSTLALMVGALGMLVLVCRRKNASSMVATKTKSSQVA